MPRYFFNLQANEEYLVDPEGTELSDDIAAHQHASVVASELMAHAAVRRRGWRLQVCNDGRAPLFDVLFAAVDPTLSRLAPQYRGNVELASARNASFWAAMREVRTSLFEIRATMRAAEGKPYLAAINGTRLDKPAS